MSMKKCPSCGNKNPESYKECDFCLRPLDEESKMSLEESKMSLEERIRALEKEVDKNSFLRKLIYTLWCISSIIEYCLLLYYYDLLLNFP